MKAMKHKKGKVMVKKMPLMKPKIVENPHVHIFIHIGMIFIYCLFGA